MKADGKLNRIVLISLLLIAVSWAAYVPLAGNGFVGFDDELYVTRNRQVQKGLSLDNVIWAFTTFDAANWHPVTWLSHMADVELFGLEPRGHHQVSLLFHLANTLLLFFLFRAMTGAVWRSAFLAALFAIHPTHVESVAWIAERKDVLSTFFGLLSLAAYIRYGKTGSIPAYAGVFCLLGLSLMAKPMLVTFPCILLLLDIWPLERCRLEPGVKPPSALIDPRRLVRLILEKVPLFVLVLGSCVVTVHAQRASGAVGSLDMFPLPIRIGNALISYIGYIGKGVWPAGLAVYYPHPGANLALWKAAAAALLIAAATLGAIRGGRKFPYLLTGWLWYVGTLVPVIGIVQVGGQAMADRYTYVPFIGLFLVIVWGAGDLFDRFGAPRAFRAAVALAVLAPLAVQTHFQVMRWKDGVVLFEHAIRVTGNSHWAQNNLGTAYGEKNPEQAIAHYRQAIRLKPDYATAHYNLGTALFEKGRLEEAARHLDEAFRLDDKDEDIRINLAYVLSRMGKKEEAVRLYEGLLAVDPDNVSAHYNLGNLMAARGNRTKAGSHYRQAVAGDPDHLGARFNLANLLFEDGDDSGALRHFAETIRIDPGYAKGYNGIGVVFARSGRRGEAERFFRKALEIDPAYTEARHNLRILGEGSRSSSGRK